MTWTQFHEADGVILGEIAEEHFAPYLVVADTDFRRYRITLSIDKEGFCHVGIDAEWSTERPGELANFTPSYEHDSSYCKADEIKVNDEGMLTVLARKQSAATVDIRIGWTAKLPRSFVGPLRKALEILKERAGATSQQQVVDSQVLR